MYLGFCKEGGGECQRCEVRAPEVLWGFLVQNGPFLLKKFLLHSGKGGIAKWPSPKCATAGSTDNYTTWARVHATMKKVSENLTASASTIFLMPGFFLDTDLEIVRKRKCLVGA